MNQKFSINPETVYHNFKGSNILAEQLPRKESIETFW